MRIFITGATGVLGREAVPRLTSAGHAVSAVSRTSAGAAWLSDHGAQPIAVDLFDVSALRNAVAGHDAVVHWATAIPRGNSALKADQWAMNDKLRDQATRALVAAALGEGVERFIQQSITFNYADGGDSWLGEDSEIDAPAPMTESALAAERHVARLTEEGGVGVVLRLSWLYGPGAGSQDHLGAIAARKLPIIGRGSNYRSRIHSSDAAAALVAALLVPAGIYNVSEDEPMTVSEELALLADLLDVPLPRHVPKAVARVAVGSIAALSARSQRVSNRRLKDASAWTPAHASAREAWPGVVGAYREALARG